MLVKVSRMGVFMKDKTVKGDKTVVVDKGKHIIYVTYIFVGLFVLVMGYYTYFMLFESKDVINNTYNKRQELLAERVLRGEILSAEGEVLARTITEEDGSETREYPYDEMFAHVVGRLAKGTTGIEASENIRMVTADTNPLDNMLNELVGNKSIGDSVVTTLRVDLQQVAYDALGDYRGAVVVMEPSTGKILAMVSKPDYDPNDIEDIWTELVEDEDKESPLLNRATQGLYPPGSTFKILTALAYIRENPLYDSYQYDCNGEITYNKMTIHCYNNHAHGDVDLIKSFAKSCNSSFANIGSLLNLDDFNAICEEFLFNKQLSFELPSNPSKFSLSSTNSSVKETMQTAIGQGLTLMTPLHNAMIVSTIANNGVMMEPYVVNHIINADGKIVKRYASKEYKKLMSIEETNILEKMMKEVVISGTASKLQGMDMEVAGKTGSAEQTGKAAHSWFVGYAPVDKPEIVVSVIVENKGTGSEYAVPIAKKIFEAYSK